MEKTEPYDVIILGTGIAGTVLGAILARAGRTVMMLEKGTHPRFAVGEAATPETSAAIHILGERFHLPELGWIGSFPQTFEHIGSSCGVKRHFGFIHHHEGERLRPEASTQSIIPDLPKGPDCHYFRQDLDAFVLHLAIAKGASYMANTTVEDVEIDGGGVTVATNHGPVRGRYLVDGTGHASLMARREGLREEPCRARTHSRSLFTHMVGVEPYEHFIWPKGATGMPRPWSQGTLHHIFDGGWLWVIPFDNHRWSTNPLCSVGLNLDPRKHPTPDCSPEEEFRAFIDRFPSFRAQFRAARATRDWVRTGRLQYSANGVVGERYCLLAHSYGFIDALFSRGLSNTYFTLHALAPVLLSALDDDDFSVERFAGLARISKKLYDGNDALVATSYASFSSFDLWNAWNRIWTLGVMMGGFRLIRARERYRQTGDIAYLDALNDPDEAALLAPGMEGFEPLFQEASALVDAASAGECSIREAASRIAAGIRDIEWAPPLRLHDLDARCVDLRIPGILKLFTWGRLTGPRSVRHLFDYDLGPVAASSVRYLLGSKRVTTPRDPAKGRPDRP